MSLNRLYNKFKLATRIERIHFIEFHEQSWFPTSMRDDITVALAQAWTFLNYHTIITPIIAKVLPTNTKKHDQQHTILDLCSGGGGPWLQLQKSLYIDHKLPVRVILSDLYPNISAFKSAQSTVQRYTHTQPNIPTQYKLDYITESVDATACQYKYSRTLFASFHHMKPVLAQQILNDAYTKHTNICIIEGTERTLLNYIRIPFSMFSFGLLSPLVSIYKDGVIPSVRRLLFTYIIPVYPIVLSVDGLTSTLRTYDETDVKQLCHAVSEQNHSTLSEWTVAEKSNEYSITAIDAQKKYSWTYGLRWHTDWRAFLPPVTYVLGKTVDE